MLINKNNAANFHHHCLQQPQQRYSKQILISLEIIQMFGLNCHLTQTKLWCASKTTRIKIGFVNKENIPVVQHKKKFGINLFPPKRPDFEKHASSKTKLKR